MFIYNYLYNGIIIITYHIFLANAWLLSMLGWSPIQMFALFTVIFMPEIIGTIQKITRKF